MYRKIIKVFLGSPGDLEDERKAAKAIVDEENSNHANQLGYHIDLVGWEDTVSQRRRAQDAINVDLDQCEYFVGLMWKKWGTPPGPKGHPYSSGFEEEYRRSVNRHEKTGKPEISLLFKNIANDDLADVGVQLEKVLNFHEEISNGKNQLYQKFQDIRDFEQKFRRIIAKFLRDQQLEDHSSEISTPQKPKPTDVKSDNQRKTEGIKKIFEGGARKFFDEFLDKEETTNSYNATEAARFRLLASTIVQSGNDSLVLGAHDANLIYRDLRDAELSEREKRGLLSAGLENMEYSTVPMWHWLFEAELGPQNELPFRTIIGSDKIRRSAFRILEKLSITPSDFEGTIDKSILSNIWFSDSASDDLIVAALEYIGSVGDDGIEIDWANLIGNSEANIAQAAVRASARITARTNVTDAIRFVAQHESTDLGKELTKDLLTNVSTIETEVLRSGLRNKTKTFLKTIATELSNRDAVTKTDAQLLCESSDAKIRLIGVIALAKYSPALTLTDARKLIVKPKIKNALSLFATPDQRDYPGERAFEQYKVGVLSELKYHDLREIEKDESFFATEATLAIYRGYFKNSKAQLDNDLLDGFERICSERRKPLLGTSSEPSDSLFKYVRENLLQSALEVYCSKASKSDLTTVRAVVDKYNIKFDAEIAEFLTNHGEWEDALRLSKLSGNIKYGLGASLLSFEGRASDFQLVAKSILKLGSKRIADAWKLDLPMSVRVQFVNEMPKRLFSAFDNQSIIDMLLMESDVVRAAVALKAVLCLSKSRLNNVLDAYCNIDGTHYYNVIFWLDLGVSTNRKASQRVALKEICSQ